MFGGAFKVCPLTLRGQKTRVQVQESAASVTKYLHKMVVLLQTQNVILLSVLLKTPCSLWLKLKQAPLAK